MGHTDLRVIPVIDILGGVVVHAKRGERGRYEPVKSILSASTEPVDIAKTFHREFGFTELYVADLDAILGRGMATDTIRELSKATSMKLMVDSGVSNLRDAQRLRDAGASEIIVGTETLDNLAALSYMIGEMGSKSVISSLDLKQGKVVSRSPTLTMRKPVQAARILMGVGVSQLIVLELTRVGSESGIDRSLTESIVKAVEIPVIVGGGIRNTNDLNELNRIGIDGALIATSLHTGTITANDLQVFHTTSRS
jgi:phosphoribosylformimino-5-aminoimidazole carboxamide ribotide isomerase